jgi:hypothetical protein
VTLAQPLGCLLDENLDASLAEPLAGYLQMRVASVRAEGWLGLKNGPLLAAMVDAQLGVLVTGDRMLYRERPRLLETWRIGVVLVREPPLQMHDVVPDVDGGRCATHASSARARPASRPRAVAAAPRTRPRAQRLLRPEQPQCG